MSGFPAIEKADTPGSNLTFIGKGTLPTSTIDFKSENNWNNVVAGTSCQFGYVLCGSTINPGKYSFCITCGSTYLNVNSVELIDSCCLKPSRKCCNRELKEKKPVVIYVKGGYMVGWQGSLLITWNRPDTQGQDCSSTSYNQQLVIE